MQKFISIIFLSATLSFSLFAQKVSFTPFVDNARILTLTNSPGQFEGVVYIPAGRNFDFLEFGGQFNLSVFGGSPLTALVGIHNRKIRTSFETIPAKQLGTNKCCDVYPITVVRDYLAPFIGVNYRIFSYRKLSIQAVATGKLLTEIRKDFNRGPVLRASQIDIEIVEFRRAVYNSYRSNHMFGAVGFNIHYGRLGVRMQYETMFGRSATNRLVGDSGSVRFENRYRAVTLGLQYNLIP